MERNDFNSDDHSKASPSLSHLYFDRYSGTRNPAGSYCIMWVSVVNLSMLPQMGTYLYPRPPISISLPSFYRLQLEVKIIKGVSLVLAARRLSFWFIWPTSSHELRVI
jgi:hypothetical protein